MNCNNLRQISGYPLDSVTIQNIQKEYQRDNRSWTLGFSGGKDSSALLKLVYLALSSLKNKSKPVTAVFCDTGVEIPIMRTLVQETFNKLSEEAADHNIPMKTKILFPKLSDRYFAKVIGRGYPPPTHKFRWCTDVLRIRPVNTFLQNLNDQGIVLLGIRKGESNERDRVIQSHTTENEYYFHQSNNKKIVIYSPIIKYSIDDIWSTIGRGMIPKSINSEKLQILYSIVNSYQTANLNSNELLNLKGRFGCWTCTVVRRDRAVENLIEGGYKDLKPLLEFRNWLSKIRDDPGYRYKQRRNGNNGFGPFTLQAREEILANLLKIQQLVPWNLIEDEEIKYIKRQWELESQ